MKIKLQSVIKTIIIVFSLLFSQLVIGQDEIVISKKIINSPTNCKQFDVTLTIEGNPPVAAQEVVLLIDVSGSMGDEVDDGTNTGNTEQIMEFAKDAAKDFVKELLSPINNPTGNNKVAIVTYASSATILTNLTGNKIVLDNYIDGLNANGGTNMEDALVKADQVLSPPNAQGTFDCGTSRSIILLTDGVPTRKNTSGGCYSDVLNTSCQTRAFTAATNAATTTVGGTTYNQSIFTVGFTGRLSNNQNTVSQNTLNTIQNSGAFYTDQAADLTSIYNIILGQLISAATALPGEALVSEQIPTAFQIVPGSLSSSSTIDSNKGNGLSIGQTINWTIEKIVEETVTLKYSILTIDSNYCGDVAAGISTMKYLNSSCVETIKVFENPEICVPCPVINIVTDRIDCTKSINYSATLNGENCGASAGSYSWKFYLNNKSVGTSSNQNGKFDYTGLPDFSGDFKAELTYNGTYTVTGCNIPEIIDTKIITLPNEIEASGIVTNVKCNNGNDGGINLTVLGGYGSYKYNWSNGAKTKDISGLEAGDYNVIITDFEGCSLTTENFTITEPEEIVLSFLGSDLSCGGSDGTIKLTVTGGATNYTYLWSNGAKTKDLSDLGAGIYTVTVTDANGCKKTGSITLISIDTEAPTITVPEELSIDRCDKEDITDLNSRYGFSLVDVLVDINNFNIAGYTANDDKEIGSISYKDEITSNDGCTTKVLRTFTITDNCGKTGTDSTIITIKDNIKPEFTVTEDVIIYAAADCTFNSAVLITGDVTDESDNCDTTLEATFTDVEASGSCEGEKIITRSWSLTDDCGNRTTKDQKITVQDNIKPEFTVPEDAIIYAAADCTFNSAVLITGDVTDESDNCDTTLEATFTDIEVVGNCEGEKIITRSWSLTDDCGNRTTKDQKITVKDNIKPDFTVPEDVIIYAAADCTFNSAVLITGDVTDESDNCDTTLEATFTDLEVSGSCEGEKIITRSWSLTDDCGNRTTKDQKITVQDNIKPDFTVPEDAIIYAAADCTFNSAVLITGDVTDESDNCDTTLEATFTDIEVVGNCEGEKIITRSWSLTDDCGNRTTKDQKITVQDNIKPEFTVPEDAIIYAAADCTFNSAVLITGDVTDESDNCDTTLEATFTDLEVSGSCEGEKIITRSWSLTDDCGNTTTKDQKITIKDNIKPELSGAKNIDIECGVGDTIQILQDWLDNHAGAIVTDNCSEVTWSNNYGDDISTKCDGNYIDVAFTATDACGNKSSITAGYLIKDETPPTITTQPLNETVECDGAGNIDALNAWLENNGGATATDDCSIVSWSNDFSQVNYTCSFIGVAEVIFTAKDICGNLINTEKRKFIIEDKEAPSLVGNLPENATVSCDAIPEAVVLTAIDNCSESTDLVVNYTEEFTGQDDDCASEYIITRRWEVSDCAGNSTSHSQVVSVEDTKVPEFVEVLPENATVSCDIIPEAVVLTATDNCSESTDLVVNYTEEFTGQDDDCASEYIITRRWEVSDCAGNSTSHSQIITVEDTKVPEFVEVLPENATVSCDAIPEAVVLTATDNCSESTDLVVNYTEEFTGQDEGCVSEYTITRTWEVSDCAGNSTSHKQIINVEDNEAPELVTDLSNLTVECDSIPEIPTLAFSDNCSENVTQTNFEEDNTFDGTDSDYEIIRTWTVSDDCGNTANFVQTINVTVKTRVIQIADSKCIDDGIIKLNDYLSDNLSNNGEWVVTAGNISLSTDATFDPINLSLGDYVFTHAVSGESCLTSTNITININDDCIVFTVWSRGCDNIKSNNTKWRFME